MTLCVLKMISGDKYQTGKVSVNVVPSPFFTFYIYFPIMQIRKIFYSGKTNTGTPLPGCTFLEHLIIRVIKQPIYFSLIHSQPVIHNFQL